MSNGTTPNTIDWRVLLGRAARMLSEGRAHEADDLISPELDRGEAPVAALLLAGVAARQRGDVRRARERLEQAVNREPDNVDARYNLAVVRRELGLAQEAGEAMEQVLALVPGHVRAATNLAEWQLEDGEPDAARRTCLVALESTLGAPTVWCALGEAQRRLGEPEDSRRSLERSLQLDPDNAAALNRLGILLKATGHTDEAMECYRRGLALTPGDAALLNNQGLAELAAGRPAAALASFDAALASDSGFEEAAFNRAAALARLHRRDEAERAARAVLDRQPESPRALALLAAILSSERNPQRLAEAERCARRALDTESPMAGAWDTLGMVLTKRGQTEAGLDAGRRAVELDSFTSIHHAHLADNLARAGHLEEAETVLRRGIEALRGDTELRRQLGIVLIRRGEHERALAELDARLTGHPQDQRAVAHRAVALEHLHRVAEARRYLGLDRFITPVHFRDLAPFPNLDAFNRALATDVREHPTLQWEPVGLAARGGALTGELLSHPTEAIRVFERNLRAAIEKLITELAPEPGHPFLGGVPREYRLNTWATLVPEQGEISTHIHEESWLSGAYYAILPEAMRTADDEHAGWIEFGRPSAELPDVPDDAVRHIRPEEGLLLLFPSYLFHRTLPFTGAGERISLSFDVEPV